MSCKSQGFALDVTDTHIAPIADANNCTLVTANVLDFPALRVLNPMAD